MLPSVISSRQLLSLGKKKQKKLFIGRGETHEKAQNGGVDDEHPKCFVHNGVGGAGGARRVEQRRARDARHHEQTCDGHPDADGEELVAEHRLRMVRAVVGVVALQQPRFNRKVVSVREHVRCEENRNRRKRGETRKDKRGKKTENGAALRCAPQRCTPQPNRPR